MFMGLLLSICLIQVLSSVAHVSHTVPIDSDHTLLLIGGRKITYPGAGEYGTNIVSLAFGESLRLAILEKSGRTWDLGDPSVGLSRPWFLYPERLNSVRVARVDRSSLVIERTMSHGDNNGIPSSSLKFFFDLTRRTVLKTIVLDNPTPVVRLQRMQNRMCATVKTTESAFLSCGDDAAQTIVAQLGPSVDLPDPVSHPLSNSYASPIPEPLPQSSYDQFARARPQSVRNGYRRDSTTIDERVGAHQVLGQRIWFGKAFYDSEGTTGVGGLGYFDSRAKRFTIFSIPKLVDWSVSALLVEGDGVWAGLVRYPEGEDYSGGLIRYDLSTHKVIHYNVPDIVLTLVRQDDALFIGTSNGLYILRAGRLTRFRFEPSLDNKIKAVRDPLP